MIILLFGISNVGKTTLGEVLSTKLNYEFYDLDQEIKNYYRVTIEGFFKKYSDLKVRDRKRSELLKRLIKGKENVVIAVSPITYIQYFKEILSKDNIVSFELINTPENIFDRLVFTDDNDNIIEGMDEYKNQFLKYYLKEISKDLEYYHEIFAPIVDHTVFMDGKNPEEITDIMINTCNLT